MQQVRNVASNFQLLCQMRRIKKKSMLTYVVQSNEAQIPDSDKKIVQIPDSDRPSSFELIMVILY